MPKKHAPVQRKPRSPEPDDYIEDRADPEDGVNQAVAWSQTEDCYREILRDSI